MVGAILSTYFNAHHGLGEKLAYFKTGSEIQREIFNQEQKGMQPSFVFFGGFVDKISIIYSTLITDDWHSFPECWHGHTKWTGKCQCVFRQCIRRDAYLGEKHLCGWFMIFNIRYYDDHIAAP